MIWYSVVSALTVTMPLTSLRNPEKRVLLQVSIEDAQAASDTIEELMGDRSDLRRDFIIRNALSAIDDLDI